MDTRLITNNPIIKELTKDLGNISNSTILTGGAVYDLLKNRPVKDYDFLKNDALQNKLEEIATLKDVSSTATTYLYKGKILQVLKKSVYDFAYTIEQSQYNLGTNFLKIDEQSFRTGILVPSESVFDPENYKVVLNCLRRLRHWEKKRMIMTDVTYNSLISLIKPIKTDDDENEEYES